VARGNEYRAELNGEDPNDLIAIAHDYDVFMARTPDQSGDGYPQ
jgi:hypothetical protein